jgi:hypothetical protein
MPIGYEQAGIEAALSNLRFVKITLAQKELVDGLTKLVASRIGMEELTCNGFWHLALKDWQIAHDLTAEAIRTMPEQERIKNASEIRDRFQEYVVPVLSNPSDQHKLDMVLDEAFKMYLQRYAKS